LTPSRSGARAGEPDGIADAGRRSGVGRGGSAAGGAPKSSRTLAEIAVLVAAAAAIRFLGIGEEPLWLDEANSVLIAWKDLPGIVDALSRDGNPPVFYFLLHFWSRIFGSSEAAVRALPALLGVLGVAGVYWAGRIFFPARKRLPIIAGAIAALGPLHIYYSQECRMYTLSPLLGLFALASLHLFLETARLRHLILHAAFLAIGLYTHNYFLFLLPAGPAIAWCASGMIERRKAFALAGAAALAALVLYLPWMPILLQQSRSGVDAWIPRLWRGTPPWAAFFRSIEAVGVGGAFPPYLKQLTLMSGVLPAEVRWPMRVVGGLLAVGLPILGVAAALRAGQERRSAVRLAIFFLLPLALPIAASFLLKPFYLVGRYEMVAFSAFALLAARGLDELAASRDAGRRPTAIACAIAWLAGAVVCQAAGRAAEVPHGDYRIAEWLRSRSRSEDVAILPGYTRTVPELYSRIWRTPGTRLSFPETVERHLGWYDEAAALARPTEVRAEAAALAHRLRRTLDPSARVIVFASNLTAPEINGWLLQALAETLGKPQMHEGKSLTIVVFGPPL